MLMGPPEELRQAEALLNRRQEKEEEANTDRFRLGEIRVGADSERAGRTLAQLRFRQTYGVTLVGIRRGETRITRPGPGERLLGSDGLIVIGKAAAVAAMKSQEPL